MEASDYFKKIWVKGLPFKIYFFGWRVWTNRVLVAATLAKWNPNISQLCSCCSRQENETMEHLFLKREIATSVWNYFSSVAGIIDPRVQIKKI